MSTLKSMTLIVLAISLLVGPGVLYNNNTNSGLNNAQTLGTGGVCGTFSPGQVVDPTCQGTVNEGCQVSSTYCTLNGQSVSFLSHTSIFTALLSGNIFALWSNLNNQGSAPIHGPWDLMGGANVAQIRANCIIDDSPGKGLRKWQFSTHSCTQAGSDTANLTSTTANTWNNWNPTLLGTAAKSRAFYQLKANASTSFSCAWQFQLNYTSGGTNTGYTWYGCQFEKGTANPLSDRVWAWWIAVPREAGALVAANKFASGVNCNGGNCYHVTVQAALVAWSGLNCATTSASPAPGATYAPYKSVECDQFWQNLNSQVQTAGSNSQAFGLLSPIILWFIGLVLLFISLGIGVGWGGSVLGTGTQGGISENEGGTRFAQALGLGLVVWVPLYSEFSTWFTTGLLPYGFDGATGIISLLLTGMMFFGVFWRALSRD